MVTTPVTPEPVTPDPVVPDPVVPDPVVPEPFTPEPVTPEPVTAVVDGEAPVVPESSVGEPVVDEAPVTEPVAGAGSPVFEEPPHEPGPPSDGSDGSDGSEGSDGSDGSDETPPSAPRSQRRAVIVLTVLTLIVVGAGIGGVLWSRSGKDEAAPPPTTQLPTTPTLADSAFVTFVDPETGFSMRYPRGWRRSEAPVREMRLVTSDGRQYSASVRVIRTEVPTTPANLNNIKSVTDGIVGPGVKMLTHETITLNGLIGFRYIYTFTDADSGLEGAHLHYFLFQGNNMYSIVFEALPTGDFGKIEGVFDQMLASFRVEPEPPGTGAPDTTVAPAPPASPPG